MVVMKLYKQNERSPKFLCDNGLGTFEPFIYRRLDSIISFRVQKSMTCSYYGNMEYKFMANRKFLGL